MLASAMGSMNPLRFPAFLSVGAGDNRGGLQHVRLQLAQCKIPPCQGWRQTHHPPIQYWHQRVRCTGRANTAVCVLPGTELAFARAVSCRPRGFSWNASIINHTTAIFRQVNKDNPLTHHDALEFPDGKVVLLTDLFEHQQATVLQLPAQPATAAEAGAQERVAYVG
jgi:hypothetical protein